MWWKSHLVISILLGAAYYFLSGSALYGFLLFSSGFFIDIDHYIIYLLAERKFNIFKIYKRFKGIKNKEFPDSDEDKYVLPFHNFEFVLTLAALSAFYPLLVPIALGVVIHFAIDLAYVRKFKIKHYYSLTYFAISKLI
jgi:hypothetical protein